MLFSVLHIQFPSDSGANSLLEEGSNLKFNALTNFTMPRCRIIELHILDPKKRMIGILFLCHDTGTIGLYMIFDWDSGDTAMINTGLPFVCAYHLRLPSNAVNLTARLCRFSVTQ